MRRLICPVLLLLTVAACGDLDPYRREGMWQPDGVAYGNLAAQLSNPHDLIEGRGTDISSGDRAAKAIQIYVRNGPGGSPSISNGAGGFTAGSGGGGSSSGGGTAAGPSTAAGGS